MHGKIAGSGCQIRRLRGLEIHYISVPSAPAAGKSCSPAAAKEDGVCPLILQTCAVACRETNGFTFNSLGISLEAKPHPNHRPKPCVWLMPKQEDVDQRKARQQFQDTRLHTKGLGADCILETVPTYPRGTEQSAA